MDGMKNKDLELFLRSVQADCAEAIRRHRPANTFSCEVITRIVVGSGGVRDVDTYLDKLRFHKIKNS